MGYNDVREVDARWIFPDPSKIFTARITLHEYGMMILHGNTEEEERRA